MEESWDLILISAWVTVCILCTCCFCYDIRRPLRQRCVKGLSPLELEKLIPRTTGEELVTAAATVCAVCLEDIESEQPARLLPGCNHAFHLQCADTWLSMNPHCPVCRANLRSSTPRDQENALNLNLNSADD